MAMQRGIGYSEKRSSYFVHNSIHDCLQDKLLSLLGILYSHTPRVSLQTLYCYVIPRGDNMMASADLVYDHSLYLLPVCIRKGNRELLLCQVNFSGESEQL